MRWKAASETGTWVVVSGHDRKFKLGKERAKKGITWKSLPEGNLAPLLVIRSKTLAGRPVGKESPRHERGRF